MKKFVKTKKAVTQYHDEDQTKNQAIHLNNKILKRKQTNKQTDKQTLFAKEVNIRYTQTDIRKRGTRIRDTHKSTCLRHLGLNDVLDPGNKDRWILQYNINILLRYEWFEPTGIC